MKLSIIIATYNRAQSLRRTLESLAVQTLDPSLFEIVAVNNNSSDDTPEVCRRFAASHPHLNFRMITEIRQGVSHACNAGIKESSGEYIAIIDDDEEANPGFAKSYYDFFEEYPDAAAAGGRIVPLYEYIPPRWLTKYTERAIAGTLHLGDRIMLFPKSKFPGGGNMGVRRSMLEKYGVFNTELGRTGSIPLGGEEKDLFRRLSDAGGKIYYIPGAIIWHIIPEERFSDEYFDKVTRLIGVSERIRTQGKGDKAYRRRLALEVLKWEATLFLSVWYLAAFRPAKGRYLRRMRWNITEGLLDI